MKNTMFSRIVLAAALTLLTGTGVLPILNLQAQSAADINDRLSQTRLLGQRLRWVGEQAPDPAQSQFLADALDEQRNPSPEERLAALERYVEAFPNSPWTPGVRARLGNYYNRLGNIMLAEETFRKIWEQTRYLEDSEGKAIHQQALARRALLLARMGAVEKLEVLINQTDTDSLLPGSDKQAFVNAVSMLAFMKDIPQMAFRCGAEALSGVGRALGVEFDREALSSLPAPVSGFSLAELKALGDQYGFGLEMALLQPGTPAPAPAVVHLKYDHFIAVLEATENYYVIQDPGAGSRIQNWPRAVLESQMSGYVLAPADRIPKGAEAVPSAVADSILGHSYCPPGDDDPPPTCPRSGGGGGGSSSNCPSCGLNKGTLAAATGMVSWRVSEPAINLWLTDEPLGYQPGVGPRVSLKLNYRTRPYPNGQQYELFEDKTSFGEGWVHPFYNYVEYGHSQYTSWILYFTGRDSYDLTEQFDSGEYSDPFYKNNAVMRKVMDGSSVDHFELLFPDGSKEVYAETRSDTLGTETVDYYFLKEIYSADGNKIDIVYDTNDPDGARIDKIVDADGRETTFDYVTGEYLVESVTDPFERTASFGYTNGALDSITDVQGIESAIEYDTGPGWPSEITTPYGTTSFEYTDDNLDYLYPALSAAWEDRSVVVTEPEGGRQIYAWAYGFSWLGSTWSSGVIPQNTPMQSTLDINNSKAYNNSFYWNRQQAASLPQDLANFTNDDSNFYLARTYHWIDAGDNFHTRRTLSIERAPHPDGTAEGQTTWYNYTGKPAANESGDQVMPALIARRLPNGDTWYQYYERNDYGLPTLKEETYTDPSTGNTATRETEYVYDTSNDIDLEEVREDPDGDDILREKYTYNSYHQVLTARQYYDTGSGDYDQTTYTYYGDGRLHTVVTEAGMTSTYGYGSSGENDGFLTSIVTTPSAVASTNSWTYLDGLIRTHTDPRGLQLTYDYDALQRVTKITYPDNSYFQYAYTNGASDKVLDRTAIRDRHGKWTYREFNGIRQLVTEIDPEGHVMEYDYCGCGGVSEVVRGSGSSEEQTMLYGYDYLGNRTSQSYWDYRSGAPVVMKTWDYNLLGQLDTATDDDMTRTYEYNNQGLLTKVKVGSNVIREILYDDDDNPVEVTDANDVTVEQEFDLLGRVVRRDYPDDPASPDGYELFGYDSSGLTVYTNQLGEITHYYYDEAGRKTGELNANLEQNSNGETLSYTYTPAGDLETLTDALDHATTWKYTEEGQVEEKYDDDSVKILDYTYSNGRLFYRWSKEKGYTIYYYNDNSQLERIWYYTAGEGSLYYYYDEANRLDQMVDAVGTTNFAYHDNGQLLYEDGPWSDDRVTYDYNDPGRRSQMNIERPSAADLVYDYEYDGFGRLDTLGAPEGDYTYTYDGNGQLIDTLTLPNSAYIDNAYDSMARLEDTWLKTSGGTTRNHHGYQYNKAHRRTRQDYPDGNYSTYDYDDIGQVTSVSYYGAGSISYDYDEAWNLDDRTVFGSNEDFSVDNLNQLTDSPLGTPSYDDNGNLEDDGQALYTYNAENQLVQVEWGSGPDYRTDFTYDGKGRLRIREEYDWNGSSWDLAETVHYIYDGMRVVQERNASNAVTLTYTRGTDLSGTLEGAGGIGGLLALSTTTTTVYYHADGNGNVTGLLSTSQSLAGSYKYDAFGNILSQSGYWAGVNPYRFSSKEQMDSGLYYYGYRFYHPDLQRWINRDPIGELGGLNLYGYVGNNPVDWIDPFGLEEKDEKNPLVDLLIKSTLECAKKACEEKLPPPTTAQGLGRAAGPVIEAAASAAEAAPGLLLIGAIQKACVRCKKCLSNPRYGCDVNYTRACDRACKRCESVKAKASNHLDKLD